MPAADDQRAGVPHRMQAKPPRPWFVITSGVIVVCAALFLVVEPDAGDSFVFMAWDILITWLLCLVLGTYKYVVQRRAFQERHPALPADDGPAA